MELDAINEYKEICEKFFDGQGFTVFFDTSISDKVRWRPHIFAKNGEMLILDILTQDKIPEFYTKKYIQARNVVPQLKIYVGIIGELNYFPDVIFECARNGFGIYKINSTLKLLVEAAEPTIENISDRGQWAISSNRPYRNILSLKKCFRNCNSYLYWFEKNLPKKVFEVLFEAIEDQDIEHVETIKLLRAIDPNLDDSYRSEFLKFKRELASKDIHVELRVITDFSVAQDFHGRYIYSVNDKEEKFSFQVPPLNSLRANQWDSILNVQEMPPFDEIWDKALDLKECWGEIKKTTLEFLKRKANEMEKQAKTFLKKIES